jgi:hypothetical protein
MMTCSDALKREWGWEWENWIWLKLQARHFISKAILRGFDRVECHTAGIELAVKWLMTDMLSWTSLLFCAWQQLVWITTLRDCHFLCDKHVALICYKSAWCVSDVVLIFLRNNWVTMYLVVIILTGLVFDNALALNLILPGTLWCGRGNIAYNATATDYLFEADACCRHHDQCPDVIRSGSTKYGRWNTSPYTYSHCQCDQMYVIIAEWVYIIAYCKVRLHRY